MSIAVAQSGAKKPLSAVQARAAALLAADELSDEAIAEQLGIGRRTLVRWKDLPEFREVISEHTAAVQAAMLRLDIAKRHKRVAVLNDLHDKLLTVIDERAAHYRDIALEQTDPSDHAAIARVAKQMFGGTEETIVPPGGETGLVVRQLKMVGSGMSAKIVEEFAVDTPLIREIRGLHEQAAKELGQWTEKVEQSGGVTVQIVGVDVEAI